MLRGHALSLKFLLQLFADADDQVAGAIQKATSLTVLKNTDPMNIQALVDLTSEKLCAAIPNKLTFQTLYPPVLFLHEQPKQQNLKCFSYCASWGYFVFIDSKNGLYKLQVDRESSISKLKVNIDGNPTVMCSLALDQGSPRHINLLVFCVSGLVIVHNIDVLFTIRKSRRASYLQSIEQAQLQAVQTACVVQEVCFIAKQDVISMISFSLDGGKFCFIKLCFSALCWFGSLVF